MLLLCFFNVYSIYLLIFHKFVLYSNVLVAILIKSALKQAFLHHLRKLTIMMFI